MPEPFSLSLISPTHIAALRKKQLVMSSPLVPFNAAHSHPVMLSSGLFDTPGLGAAHTLLDNISPLSTSITSGLGTPHDQSLLSPFIASSQTTSTIGALIGSMANENSTYIQLSRQYEEVCNAYIKEKQEHEWVKYIASLIVAKDIP
jgi:hypothetical protein